MRDDLLRTPTEGQDLTGSLLPEARPVEPPNINLATGKPVDAAEPASPRFSFRGWSFTTWAAKNADFVKGTLSVASAATAGITVSDLATLKAFGLVWGLAAAAIGSRALADAVHYFLAEQPLEPKS